MKKVFSMIMMSLLLIIGVQAQETAIRKSRPSGVVRTQLLSVKPDARQRDSSCDTLRFPMGGTITYYTIDAPDDGYVTGNNSYGDKAKAEFYTGVENGYAITGIVAEFAIAKSTSSSNADIIFGIWDNTGAGGGPGEMKASGTYPLEWIIEDIAENWLTILNLEEPYIPAGPFYVGIVLPQTPGDTVALWCTKSEPSYVATAWEQWNDNSWHDIGVSWQLNTTMLLHPIVCQLVGIEDVVSDPQAFISSNPSNGIVNVKTWRNKSQINLEVYSLSGQKVYAKSYPGTMTNFNIDLEFLPQGVYVVRLFDESRQHTQKILLK